MKRKLLLVAGLLALLVAGLFWLIKSPRTAHPAGPGIAPAAKAPALAGVAKNAAAPAKAAPGFLTGTNRLAYRLANTSKTLQQLLQDPHAILLQNALIDTAAGLGGLDIPQNLMAKGDPGAYIVQAHGPTTPAFRAVLQAAGARIVSYIPNNAYLVKLAATGAARLAASPLVQAVIPYQPYYKLQPTLLALARADAPLPPATFLTVGLFNAADEPELAAAGYVTVGMPDQSPFGPILHVLPPLTQPLSRLAALPGVQAIELGHMREPANDLARVTLGISADTLTPTNWLNLSGLNVMVEVNDSGVDATHPDFSVTGSAETPGVNPPTRVNGDFASSLMDTVGHGTHVAGIIAGNGSESYTVTSTNPPQGSVTNADFRGKAPAALLYSVGNIYNGISDKYLQEAPALTNALISNNSWDNGDPAYDLAAASYDAATRDALPLVPGSQPVLFVFAAGNDGGGASDGTGGDPDTILSPGTAKNVITVGALEEPRDITNVVTTIDDGQTNMVAIWQPETDNGSQVADYSARGNVGLNIEGPYGRFKPDVVAPGSWVVSTRSSQLDTNVFFNSTNVQSFSYTYQIVGTNYLNYYNVTVPPNAVGVDITITANSESDPFPSNLIIYAQISGYPDPVNNPGAIDITTMNDMLDIPPSSNGAITGIQAIQNSGFDIAVADSTNVPVNYDLTISVLTTNNNGDEEQVLEQLNDGLAPWYLFETGTSMAAPAISGTLALIQDYFTNQLQMTPSPALLKAMLINGSRTVGGYGYAVTNGNNFMGWGLPNIQNSLPLTSSNLTSTSIISGANAPMFVVDQSPTNALATGDSHTYIININTNTTPSAQTLQLQATLVWTDPPGDPSAAIKLVNGLELVITNLDTGEVFYGNDISFENGYNLPYISTNGPPNIDTINNVENVILSPKFENLASSYSVTVIGRQVNVNAVTEQATNVVQDYALVVSVGEGEVPNAIALVKDQGIASNLTLDQDITDVVTTNAPLVNQFVGADTPFQGTNQIGLGSNTIWGSTGALTLGMTNQWHFYVITNTGQTADVTNAAFITYDAYELSVPRMGVYEEADPTNATRPEADIDLYATTDPGLTNLSPVTLSNCLAGVNNSGASLGQGGDEFVYFTNSSPGQVYYVGVKSEDQMASEYDFIPIFTATPFSQLQPNGDQLVNGLVLPTAIPDGSPAVPGIATVFALAIFPMQIENVIVTNLDQHQNFGDLIGSVVFNGSSAVLNNHDGYANTFNTNAPFVYDDSRDPIPGSSHSDGPGNLTVFQTKEGQGAWMLTVKDDVLGNTGQVSQFNLLIQPHRNLKFPGIIVSIPPGGWFNDYVTVPPGYTNLTFYATNLPPIITPPLQMYEKFGEEPTLTDFDFEVLLTNTLYAGGDPGNSISIGPPLDIGNYYVGVYNPSTTETANVFIAATLGIDTSANDNFTYSANGPQLLLPDAVTNSDSIFVSATQLVESVNVGMVVSSPQISDLTFTLVSPTGQRVLLMENRGAFSTNGAGATFVYTNILNSTAAGGAAANTNYLAVPSTGTVVPITYNFYTVPDEMTVYEGTNPATFYPPNNSNPYFLYDTGFTNFTGSFTVATQPGYTNITIIMNQFGNPYVDKGGGDAWIYTAGAPSTNYEYLTFTDDTNLANVPIKFAVPPFSFSPSNPPNYTLSDFETASNGIYFAPTNIPDQYGGWSVPTNIATYATVVDPTNGTFVTVTNNLVLTNNFVSVVADPADSVGDDAGTNFLALARGTITRTIPTVPGDIYNVTFWYRGPGIASWWRGEGNASDSSDPENNANNGTLVGSFNFPAGEVDQAFQFENGGSEFDFAGTNAYVQARQSASLNVGTASGFTVEGWINPTNTGRPQPLVEWLAGVPTNAAVTNLVIKAGPYLDLATGHYYYLLGATDWITSEQWSEALGGHLATIATANLQNWVFDNFAGSGPYNHNLWIGLTNSAGTNFGWASGETNITYANWQTNPPDTSCGTFPFYAGILGNTNAQPGLWVLANDNGVTCAGATNLFYGVAEVPMIQTNGVQFWISATNTPGTTNAPFALTNGTLYANIVDTNFVSHEIYSAPGLLASNVFQHVALTYDTNSGLAMLYLNGVNVATTNFGTNFMAKTDGDVLLGRDMSPNTNNSFGGLMDEMSIYRRALSPAEILAIYQVSAFTTNRTVGKFDPSVMPAYGLAEALVSFGGTTNLLFGVNNSWEQDSYTFTATSNSMPLTISGLEPGILLDDFEVAQAPVTNLYYLPEQDLSALTGVGAYGNWTLQAWDNLNGALLTNVSQILSWQLSLVLQSNATFAASLAPETPTASTVPAGQTVFYQVNVPAWASEATNILVSSSLPVNLYFNPTNTPTGTGPGDQTLLTASTGGVSTNIIVNTNEVTYAPFQAGSTYYLGVQNNNATPAQVVLQVDYNLVSLTNGAPYSAAFGTNDSVQYYEYTVGSNAYEATFQLLKMSGNADLVVSPGVPLPSLTNSAYGSFNVSNLDQSIYVLTNSEPVPLGPGTWYLGVIKRDSGAVKYSVLAQELDVTNNSVTNSVNIINLTSGVPVNYNAGPGADLTNFYAFTVAASTVPGVTNYGVMFELYNLTGNGDLTVQTNGLPLAPPFFQTSQNRGVNPESIILFTNAGFTNINLTYYLGVPSHEITNINYTIAAEVLTNEYFPGFPGANGMGGGAVGAGHAGTVSTVYHVVSTNDDGSAGTLRAAVNGTNRTVVFDLSGIITLTSPLVITNSYLTIAGQTAPGGGITVVGQMTAITNTHDVIIRDVRFRSGGASDSLQFLAASNVLADHISAEWSYGNLVSVLYSTNVTVQWSLLGQDLYTGSPFEPTNPTAVASLFLGGGGAFSFNHNLYADNNNGNPVIGDNLSLDFVNNVVYDWGTNAGFSVNGGVSSPGGATNELNYTCNYFIATSNSVLNTIAFNGGSTNTWIFQTNNFMDSNTNGILDGANTKWAMFTNQFTEFGHPFPFIPVPTDEAYQAYEKVLDFAGVNMSQRDPADDSMVANVRSQTGTLIGTAPASPTPASLPVYLDTDQDGIPDFWEITFGQPPYVPSNNNASTNAPGYTTLEEYNNWLAGPHAVAVTNTSVSVDLQRLFGQTGNLSFFVTNAVNGSVYLTNVLGAVTNTGVFSNSIAVFTPTNTTPAFTGYASFDAYVTNNDTVAYFGPVTVSVVVSPVAPLFNSNIPPVITPLVAQEGSSGPMPQTPPSPSPDGFGASGSSATVTNYGGSDYYVVAVTNMDGMSPVAVLFTITNASGPVDLVANYGDSLKYPSLSSYEFISTNPWPESQSILISSNSTPVAITNGNWYLAAVNVAGYGSNVTYTISATEFFTVLPPIFESPTNQDVFTNVVTFQFSNNAVATDPNTPPLPLTFALASGPTNMSVTPAGVITWTPTAAQGPDTNGPSTNAIAVSVSNGDFTVTNTFSIIVVGTNIAPVLATNPPNQVVIVTNGVLVVTNAAANPSLPALPLVYTLVNPPLGAGIDANGVITWMPTLAQAGSNYLFTTVVTDTNPWAINAPTLSATNSFLVTVEPGLLPGQPQTNTVMSGSLNWIAVAVPTNAIIATNTLLFTTNAPVNVWFSTNVPPSITNAADAELLTNSTGGTDVLYTNRAPLLVPGGIYFLGVQNTNAVTATYALSVTFDLVTARPPRTNAVPFHSIIHTNIGGTNGFLLTWYAPSNDLFTLQWTTTLAPAGWVSFTNTIGYNTNYPASLSNAVFTFFDDGSQDGGLTSLNHFYRLIVQGQGMLANSLYLPAQSGLVIGPQTALAVTNTAVDSNPYAVVSYQLVNPPAGAAIDTNGLITWTTPAVSALTTNVITTVATDNGTPAASATNSFQVVVEPVPKFSGEHLTTNGLELTWYAPSNELFQVAWSTNLLYGPYTRFTNIISYDPALFTSPGSTEFDFTDDGAQSGPFSIPHYYRLILLPSVVSSSGPGPLITGVAVTGGGTTLRWTAPTNETFKVQWTTNLLPPVVWTPFTNIIGSSTTNFSFTDTNLALLMKFYELLLQP